MSNLNTEITQRKAKERSLQIPLSYCLSHSFVLKCMSKNFVRETYHCTKTYYKQTETIKH